VLRNQEPSRVEQQDPLARMPAKDLRRTVGTVHPRADDDRGEWRTPAAGSLVPRAAQIAAERVDREGGVLDIDLPAGRDQIRQRHDAFSRYDVGPDSTPTCVSLYGTGRAENRPNGLCRRVRTRTLASAPRPPPPRGQAGEHRTFLLRGEIPPARDFLECAVTPQAAMRERVEGAHVDAGRRNVVALPRCVKVLEASGGHRR